MAIYRFLEMHDGPLRGLARIFVRARIHKKFRANPTPNLCLDSSFNHVGRVEEQRSVEPGVGGAPCIVDCYEGVGWLGCSYGSAREGVLVAVDVLVAVQEGYVGEGITAPLHLVGLWGREMLSDSTNAHL